METSPRRRRLPVTPSPPWSTSAGYFLLFGYHAIASLAHRPSYPTLVMSRPRPLGRNIATMSLLCSSLGVIPKHVPLHAAFAYFFSFFSVITDIVHQWTTLCAYWYAAFRYELLSLKAPHAALTHFVYFIILILACLKQIVKLVSPTIISFYLAKLYTTVAGICISTVQPSPFDSSIISRRSSLPFNSSDCRQHMRDGKNFIRCVYKRTKIHCSVAANRFGVSVSLAPLQCSNPLYLSEIVF